MCTSPFCSRTPNWCRYMQAMCIIQPLWVHMYADSFDLEGLLFSCPLCPLAVTLFHLLFGGGGGGGISLSPEGRGVMETLFSAKCS
jgi:hypothetical protein